jgi:hypothetical protein
MVDARQEIESRRRQLAEAIASNEAQRKEVWRV